MAADPVFVFVFSGLFVAYGLYSVWARLDPRLPVVAAIGLFLLAAGVAALGALDLAETLADFVFVLLAGGVLLMLLDRAPGRRTTSPADEDPAAPQPPISQAAQGGQRSAEDPLDGL